MANLTSSEVFQVVFGAVGGVISVLLIVVAFFLRKLVHKTDLVDPLMTRIATLAERLDAACKKVDELCGKVESLDDLRIEVATIKARFLSSSKTRHGGNGEVIDEELPS